MAIPTRTKSRWETLSHRAKVAGLAAERRMRWAVTPRAFAAGALAGSIAQFPTVVWQRRVALHRTDAHATPLYEAGKRHNLALAAPAFDGVLLSPSSTLSFWRTLGEATAARGFRHGMELNGGCVVPAIGGGICLLSNTLFALAVETGCTIVERYGHSVSAVPLAEGEMWGLDATAFYPYIDLRVRATEPLRLGVHVEGDWLIVEARAAAPLAVRVELTAEADRRETIGADEFRMNRIRRRRFVGDALVGEEIVAENRKRMMVEEEAGRSCLTCGDEACHTRPKQDLPRLIAENARYRRA